MDQLLLGYASSDGEPEENDTNRGDRDGKSNPGPRACENADIKPKSLPDDGAPAQETLLRPSKRAKRAEQPARCADVSSNKNPERVSSSAAPAPALGRPALPGADKLLALPNPLALLEAGSEEERRGLLVSAAAAPAAVPSAGPARVRTFPHVVGNFPTVVLMPVHGMDEQLDAVYRRVRRLLPDLEPMTQDTGDFPTPAPGPSAGSAKQPQGSNRGASRPGSQAPPPSRVTPPAQRCYHVSLSRSVPIRHPQIAPLTSTLAERLGGSAVGPFCVSLAGLRSFANDEGTRSFVSIMVAQGSQQICSLIRQVDSVFQQHGLPPFYEVPLPHVSVGWLPGDQCERIDAALRRLRPSVSEPSRDEAPGAGGAAAGPAGVAGPAGQLAAASDVVCSWQAARAVCVVGQREYEVWRPSAQ